MTVSGITTFLWFDEQALEAAEFYVSVFPDSRITSVSHYRADAQKPAGTVLTVDFEMFGQRFSALNGGPQFTHSEAVSFQMQCDTQDEIDRIWDALVSDGGAESRCGWCKDRFGISWQVVPTMLGEAFGGPDPEAADRAFRAMMEMGKLDIAGLRRAAAGE